MWDQDGWSVRLEWGPVGAETMVAGCGVVAVVDVLSFTTTLSVAADRGVEVFPVPARDERARALAVEHDAVLAGRRDADAGGVSLSPGSVRTAERLERLVLPSPNGATISTVVAGRVPVVGVSLRNCGAVARWLLGWRRQRPDLTVGVVPAGERWPDGSLRPAVEDLWGAGALVTALLAGGWPDASPEAVAAASGFTAVAGDPAGALAACGSGRELIGIGFADDVAIAAELDASEAVPVLSGRRSAAELDPLQGMSFRELGHR